MRTGQTESPAASGGSFTARRTAACFRSTRRRASSIRDSASGESAIFEMELDRQVAALDYGPTSAPAIWNDTIIVGVSCGEGPGIAAPGDIRAFDVRTGKEVWRFATVPQAGRLRKRDVERRFVEGARRCQCVGRLERRRRPRHGVRRTWLGRVRLLRRRPARR